MISLGRKITDAEGQVWHTRRRWVPLSPAVCQVKDCGFDFIELHKLTIWDEKMRADRRMYWEEMTPQEQEIALRVMADHASTHRHEAAQVINIKDEADMNWPPTKKTGSRLPKRLKSTF